MTLASLIPLILQVSIWLTVFALGLRAGVSDVVFVLQRPWVLVRSLLAMMVIMPVVAVLLVKVMNLPSSVALALVALSLAPVPPLLPGKQEKAGARQSYSIGLLVAASLVSIVWLPIAVKLVGAAFNYDLRVPAATIGGMMLFTILAPLAVGVLFRRLAPGAADKLQPIAKALGMLLLIGAVIPVLITKWPAIRALVGDGTLLAFAVFVFAGLAAGHLLGGPEQEDRTVLATAAASHHPGIALQIAQLNFPDEPSIAPAVLLYLIATAVLTMPYILWRKRVAKGAAETVTPTPTGR
jgi:bile acid:Na+ symporter, BASS family